MLSIIGPAMRCYQCVAEVQSPVISTFLAEKIAILSLLGNFTSLHLAIFSLLWQFFGKKEGGGALFVQPRGAVSEKLEKGRGENIHFTKGHRLQVKMLIYPKCLVQLLKRK